MGILFVLIIGLGVAVYILAKINQNNKKNANKFYAMFLLNLQWMTNLQGKKSIADYLWDKGYRRVAIYGMSDLGKALMNELKESELTLEYVIDRNAGEVFVDRPVLTPDDDFPETDVIIVTPFLQYKAIKSLLQNKSSCDVLSIKDIVNEM